MKYTKGYNELTVYEQYDFELDEFHKSMAEENILDEQLSDVKL